MSLYRFASNAQPLSLSMAFYIMFDSLFYSFRRTYTFSSALVSQYVNGITHSRRGLAYPELRYMSCSIASFSVVGLRSSIFDPFPISFMS